MRKTDRLYDNLMALHNEVSGSSILNTFKFPDDTTKEILVDFGLFQEKRWAELNKKETPFKLSEIDHVIVTHNHVDHVGRLPLLVKNGYRGKIHMSYTNAKLLPYALYDSYKILKKESKQTNEPQMYSESDVDETLKLVVGHNFEETFKLDENIKCTFFMNGHLPGAVVCLMQIKYRDHTKHYEDINLLFTGDYNNKNVFFDVKPIPKWVYQLPISIIQESTYGDMDSTQVEHIFEKNVLNAIKEKKEIIIPVFSLGRTQEVMYTLKQWQMNGKLSTDIPIYLDGKLAWGYTNLYLNDGLDNREECKNFKPENFTYVSDFETRNTLINDGKPKIILCTSGMGTYGPSQTYIQSYLPRKNALIHFTGYCAEGSLGRKLHDCKQDDFVNVFGIYIKKSADVQFTSEFSAHAKADELIDFLRPFEDIKLLLVNHGNSEKKEIYANRVLKEIHPKDVGILNRDYFFRFDGYGLIKSMLTRYE